MGAFLADPGQTFTSWDLTADGRYPARRDVILEGSISLHRAGLRDTDFSGDFNRTDIRLGVRWLFDVAPSSGRASR